MSSQQTNPRKLIGQVNKLTSSERFVTAYFINNKIAKLIGKL